MDAKAQCLFCGLVNSSCLRCSQKKVKCTLTVVGAPVSAAYLGYVYFRRSHSPGRRNNNVLPQRAPKLYEPPKWFVDQYSAISKADRHKGPPNVDQHAPAPRYPSNRGRPPIPLLPELIPPRTWPMERPLGTRGNPLPSQVTPKARTVAKTPTGGSRRPRTRSLSRAHSTSASPAPSLFRTSPQPTSPPASTPGGSSNVLDDPDAQAESELEYEDLVLPPAPDQPPKYARSHLRGPAHPPGLGPEDEDDPDYNSVPRRLPDGSTTIPVPQFSHTDDYEQYYLAPAEHENRSVPKRRDTRVPRTTTTTPKTPRGDLRYRATELSEHEFMAYSEHARGSTSRAIEADPVDSTGHLIPPSLKGNVPCYGTAHICLCLDYLFQSIGQHCHG